MAPSRSQPRRQGCMAKTFLSPCTAQYLTVLVALAGWCTAAGLADCGGSISPARLARSRGRAAALVGASSSVAPRSMMPLIPSSTNLRLRGGMLIYKDLGALPFAWRCSGHAIFFCTPRLTVSGCAYRVSRGSVWRRDDLGFISNGGH